MREASGWSLAAERELARKQQRYELKKQQIAGFMEQRVKLIWKAPEHSSGSAD